MTNDFKWLKAGGLAALAGAAITVAGCTTQAPVPPAGIEQKIENASSRSDHDGVALQYEQQASVDAATAKRHIGYAASYRKNRSQRSGVQANESLAQHCEALARTYEQAAQQNLAMAKLHRGM